MGAVGTLENVFVSGRLLHSYVVDDRDNVCLSWSLFFSADMVTIVYIISLACDWLAHSN